MKCRIKKIIFFANIILIFVLQVNERAGQIIQYDKFYIHELDELIDIRNDYVTWFQQQMFSVVSFLHCSKLIIIHF